MFEKISDSFSKISNRLRGWAHLSEANLEQVLREIRMSLIEADVALPVVRDFISQVKEQALGQKVLQSLTPGQMFIGIFSQQLEKFLGSEETPWVLPNKIPTIIMLVGLQGVGKTTQIAKLAKWLINQKKKVMVVSCDNYRPAAIDQLSILANQINCDCFTLPEQTSKTSIEIATAATIDAKSKLYDVLLIDTAGRLSIDQEMMDELSNLANTIKPDDVWLTVDAMQGQDAINTAKIFKEKVDISGLILTKADGDARGGAILSARVVTGASIRFIGVSEKIDGLEIFNPKRIADRILGKGDIVGLFESAQNQLDQKNVSELAKKIVKNRNFNLSDFRDQLTQMQKIGDFESIISKLPSSIQQFAKNTPSDFGDTEIKKMQGIIDSMTIKERNFPALLKASRKKRVAEGSGTSVQDVNRLINKFEQMQKVTKKFKGGFKGISGFPGLGNFSGIDQFKHLLGK